MKIENIKDFEEVYLAKDENGRYILSGADYRNIIARALKGECKDFELAELLKVSKGNFSNSSKKIKELGII